MPREGHIRVLLADLKGGGTSRVASEERDSLRHNYKGNLLIIYPRFSLMRDRKEIAKRSPYKRNWSLKLQCAGSLY